jgi:PAS domain S-box-containing protein
MRMTSRDPGDTLDFISGQGGMSAAVREKAWDTTVFGPIANWPQSLRSAVSICLGSSFQIAIYWGPDLALIYNDDWSPILGSKHPWALGRPAREVWPEIWDTIGPLFDSVMTTGRATRSTDQLLAMHRHGFTEECYFDYTFSPIRGEGGKVGGIFNAVVETTFRVINERRTGLLRDLNEMLGQATSVDRVYQIARAAFEEAQRDVAFALLYVVDESSNSLRKVISCCGGLPEHACAETMPVMSEPWPFDQVLDEGRVVHLRNLPKRLGATVRTQVWPEPVHEALLLPLAGFNVAAPDGVLICGVSPRLALDSEYRAFLERLASTIGSASMRARTVEQERRRADELARLDRAKTAFFSNASHEFRTPLTLMLAPLQDLLSSSDDEPSVARQDLELMHRNGLRLLKLVNTLLDFSRIEAGRVDAAFEPVDLAQLTTDLASNYRSAMERAGLEFSIECPGLREPIYVDRDMWEKIVLNLISNAFKYTLHGSVTVRLSDRNDQEVELQVIDTGVGIPEEAMSKLFERFYRIENQQGRTLEGTGIGLALVQELVRLHGGSVSAESEVGRGTTFKVVLRKGQQHLDPDRIAAPRALATTAIRAEAFVEEALRWLPESSSSVNTAQSNDVAVLEQRMRLLIADDNADMRSYLERLFGSHNDVQVVSDGEAAWAALEAFSPDVLLTDVMMPKLDGFGLLKRIRQSERFRHLPVIMLSARAGAEASSDARAAGADDYVVKPFAARELAARINAVWRMAALRQQSLAALQQSERMFRMIADQAPVMIWLAGQDGKVTYLNARWYEYTGQVPPSAEGLGWLQNVHPEDRARIEQADEEVARTRRAFRFEYRLCSADGTYRWMLDSGIPRFDANGEFDGFIGSVVDVTQHREAEHVLRRSNAELEALVAQRTEEFRKAEEALRQASKMEAIGQLTGGIAHDFNNLLTVVIGNLDSVQRRAAGDAGADRLKRAADNAMAGAKRAAALTQRLLAFARRQPLDPKPTDLSRLVTSMIELLTRTLGERIEIQTVFGAGLWRVEIDRNQLESALLNLALNARDAMPDGGKLTIETSNTFIDELYVAKTGEMAVGQYAVLAVSDTGHGMGADVLARVFEPFFTTKPVGHGSGLGLPQVYGFVKQSGGHIKVYSEVNGGTTVKIYLPRMSRDVDEESETTQAEPLIDGSHNESVLVVEDEAAVREYSCEILRELGYRVLEAKDGNHALHVLEREPNINLLFTDVGLPGMTGRELAGRAREMRPGLKVLFTTGYARNAIVHHGRLDPGVQLLVKPFTYEDLAGRIRGILDET